MSQSVEQAAAKILARTEKIIRSTLLGSASRIIEDSPVDTGLLRSNWQATLDRGATGEVSNRGESAAKSEAASKVLAVKIGSVFYLTNNVFYAGIQELQNGMVRREMARLASKLGS
tara:strand:+ start:159 stop:506 length:348 start_codon:yes stop_codon:yes gene_type:complete